MSIFNEEQKYLDFTLDAISKEIQRHRRQIDELKKESIGLSYEDRLKGTHLALNSKLYYNGKMVDTLIKSIPNPYFGRIDFIDDSDSILRKIYVGRSGVSHNNDIVVTDWRAPVSSLFYDNKIGRVSYSFDDMTVDGVLQLKRQIQIKDSKLTDVMDGYLTTNDELLRPYLSVNADNKMKTIIASIQKEQNNIIRRPLNENIIVQGVAGSGKTSVALHRIAYLIYNYYNDDISNKFLVIGPNDYFLKYISSILPDLDTTPVSQLTLISLLNEYLGDEVTLNIPNNEKNKKNIEYIRNVEKFKTTMHFKDILKDFINHYYASFIKIDDFMIDGQVVFSSDYIRSIILMDKYPKLKSVSQYLKKKYEENRDEIYHSFNKKYRDIYISAPKNSIERNDAIEKSNNLHKLVYKEGIKLLNKYLKKIEKNCFDIYKEFIENIDSYEIPLTEKEKLLLQKNTLLFLKKKRVNVEDIPVLMYIRYRMTGNKLKYSNIVIDEAQDYGEFLFYVLKEITNNANFSIYGDLAQSINSYKSVDSWDKLNSDVFDNNFNVLNLSKSYRTTVEITQVANNILEHLKLNSADPVIRHGMSVQFFDLSIYKDLIYEKIISWLKDGYKTIAVICKTEDDTLKIYSQLLNRGLDIKHIDLNDKDYDGGIFVLTSASAKGLEFDCVIISDASNNNYLVDSDIDMRLLYVACTRALHEQVILYDTEIVDVFKSALYDYNLENKVKRKILK